MAMTELLGNPDSMKWADSAVMARSASVKVRRLGGWPVMFALLSGSSSASASGVRARIRRNNPSSVGVALGWITGITWLESRVVATRFPEDIQSRRWHQAV